MSYRCKDQNVHREFKHQSGVGLVVYNEELANLICLVHDFSPNLLFYRVHKFCNELTYSEANYVQRN